VTDESQYQNEVKVLQHLNRTACESTLLLDNSNSIDIPQLIAFGNTTDGKFYIAMELFGVSLYDIQ